MNARELFDAMGVIQDTEVAIYRYLVDAKAFDIRIFDADTRRPPTTATTRYVAEAVRDDGPDRAKYWDVAVETTDPRDVMAFCLACENSRRFDTTGDPAPEDQTFAWEGIAMHNPFAAEPYWDWDGEQRTDWPHNEDGRMIVVPNPATLEWGSEYLAWRDAYAERLLAPARHATP